MSTRRRTRLPNPVRHLTDLERRIAAESHTLICCDYYGTLTTIRGRPQDAALESRVKRLLTRLRDHPRFSVAIVSGRSLSDLKQLVNVNGIWSVGNHGLEIDGPGLTFVHPDAARYRPVIRTLVAAFRRTAVSVPGVVIEDKRWTLSVHYRLTPPPLAALLLQRLQAIAEPYRRNGTVMIGSGKQVFEIRLPIPWHKGSATLWLRHHVGALRDAPRLFTIYFGDDLTDEDAFRAVQRSGGVGIHVGDGSRPTVARLHVPNVNAALRWLEQLVQ